MTDEVTTLTTAPAPVKPGWQTTEGIFTALANTIGTLYVLGIVAPDGTSAYAKAIAFVAMVLGNFGYAVSRAKVKAAAS